MEAMAGAKAEAKVAGRANQIQVPVIQTQDSDMTQFQQNTNKVLRNLNNQIVSAQIDINQEIIIGEIKIASLTLDQFQNFAGTDWILANGQSSVGTKYAQLTGNNTVPTITVTGATTFIRVN